MPAADRCSAVTLPVTLRRRVGVIAELLRHERGAAAGPSRCMAELMAVAIVPASGVPDGCSADANSAWHHAWVGACRIGRGVLAGMGHLLSVLVRGRAGAGSGIAWPAGAWRAT
jgi:hypothetical protein